MLFERTTRGFPKKHAQISEESQAVICCFLFLVRGTAPITGCTTSGRRQGGFHMTQSILQPLSPLRNPQRYERSATKTWGLLAPATQGLWFSLEWRALAVQKSDLPLPCLVLGTGALAKARPWRRSPKRHAPHVAQKASLRGRKKSQEEF